MPSRVTCVELLERKPQEPQETGEAYWNWWGFLPQETGEVWIEKSKENKIISWTCLVKNSVLITIYLCCPRNLGPCTYWRVSRCAFCELASTSNSNPGRVHPNILVLDLKKPRFYGWVRTTEPFFVSFQTRCADEVFIQVHRHFSSASLLYLF